MNSRQSAATIAKQQVGWSNLAWRSEFVCILTCGGCAGDQAQVKRLIDFNVSPNASDYDLRTGEDSMTSV